MFEERGKGLFYVQWEQPAAPLLSLREQSEPAPISNTNFMSSPHRTALDITEMTWYTCNQEIPSNARTSALQFFHASLHEEPATSPTPGNPTASSPGQ